MSLNRFYNLLLLSFIFSSLPLSFFFFFFFLLLSVVYRSLVTFVCQRHSRKQGIHFFFFQLFIYFKLQKAEASKPVFTRIRLQGQCLHVLFRRTSALLVAVRLRHAEPVF